MLPVQLEELSKIRDCLLSLLEKTSDVMMKKEVADFKDIENDKEELWRLADEFDKNQVERIQDDSSKTRLSILFYGFIRDSKSIAGQTFQLLKIFRESFKNQLI